MEMGNPHDVESMHSVLVPFTVRSFRITPCATVLFNIKKETFHVKLIQADRTDVLCSGFN